LKNSLIQSKIDLSETAIPLAIESMRISACSILSVYEMNEILEELTLSEDSSAKLLLFENISNIFIAEKVRNF
jgi:hypothetical protein